MRHSALGDTGEERETECTMWWSRVEKGATMARDESRGGTTITTYHDWLRAWQCMWAIRPTATILRVFRLVPGHQLGGSG